MKPLPQFRQNPIVMKARRSLAYGLVLITVICISQQLEIRGLARRGQSVSEEMRAFSRQIVAAYEKRDTKTLKSFYAKQPNALFFWERRMTYSWPQIDTTLDTLVAALSRLNLTINEFRSGGDGSTGWYAATFHAERVTAEGKQFTSDGRWTVIAQKIDGRWLIVHEHTSFPAAER